MIRTRTLGHYEYKENIKLNHMLCSEVITWLGRVGGRGWFYFAQGESWHRENLLHPGNQVYLSIVPVTVYTYCQQVHPIHIHSIATLVIQNTVKRLSKYFPINDWNYILS